MLLLQFHNYIDIFLIDSAIFRRITSKSAQPKVFASYTILGFSYFSINFYLILDSIFRFIKISMKSFC